MIIYGHKNTGKSQLLRKSIFDYLTQQLNNHTATTPFTYQLSAVEVQAPEKVVCLLSLKPKEVTEDRNSYFHVHIEDYY